MSDDELLARWQLITQGITLAQHRVSEQVGEEGLPAQWFATLHLLLDAPQRRLPMSRLARDLTMTSGGFTKLADRMAREGLIDRRGSSDDRRVVYATLTEVGVRTATRLTGEYVRALREHVAEVVSAADLARLAEVAQVLCEHYAQVSGDYAQAAGDEAQARAGETSRDPAQPERRGRGRATS